MRFSILHFVSVALAAAADYDLLHIDSLKIKDTLNITAGDIVRSNKGVGLFVREVVHKPYFSTYKVDLSTDMCPFKDADSGVCGNRACAIETMEQDPDLPWEMQSQFLSKLREDSISSDAPEGSVEECAPETETIFAYPPHDYCYPEDESSDSRGVWVDLNDNTERFTGYSGPHAHKVWRAVYQENCFGYSGDDESAEYTHKGPESAQAQLANVFSGDRYAKQELGGEENRIALNKDQQCVEQRLFYRLLSGMQASISAHLCYDYLNQTTGKWGPNLPLFMERVGDHQERLNNLFFNYVLVSRALTKLQGYIQLLSFSSSCPQLDSQVRFELHRIGHYLSRKPQTGDTAPGFGLNETELFHSPESKPLKDEFRKRVRNVNALMSCTGCERCRLWGKIQTAGYGTALKILFELPENPEEDPELVSEVLSSLRRSELVALVQTFARLSHSVSCVGFFSRRLLETVVDKYSFSYQIHFHWQEMKRAFRFFLDAYINFPRNIWRILVFHANIYWNRFVGKQVTLSLIEQLEKSEL